MAVITNQTLVACTPEQLFDYCVDNRNELEWNPTGVSIEKITDGPVGLGTKFLAKWKGGILGSRGRVLEFDRPRRWVSANDGPIAVRATGKMQREIRAGSPSNSTRVRPDGSALCSRSSC